MLYLQRADLFFVNINIEFLLIKKYEISLI